MAQQTEDLQEIMKTLDSLQAKVKELTDPPVAGGDGQTPTPSGARPVQDSAPEEQITRTSALPGAVGQISQDHMGLLRQGIADISHISKLKDFPAFFDKLSEKTGLRMVLLKRWTTGLQVFMERNIKMPSEAKRKRKDGRAPIPCAKGDVFSAVGEEASVYCGPVPVKHFPLDLTLMLGRGSKDRQIIILPLPSQNHWNTFLYLDADQSGEKELAVAEVLAHFALARMCLLNKGVQTQSGKVAAILKAEVYRRRKAAGNRAASESPVVQAEEESSPRATTENSPLPEPGISKSQQVEDMDPFVVQSHRDGSEKKQAEKIPLVPRKPLGQEPLTADDLPDYSEDLEKGALTPQGVLHHSGELPALPKAACHIMAVIEDPKTTATRLEKALAMDQALTAKVLRIANSPFYGAVREIRTVSEAIVRLGFVSIRNWTVVTATKSVFLAPGAGSLYKKIWRQSVMSAMAGQLVAQHLRLGEPESIFIGGLMQNIGQLVLARSHPELFQQILTESEHSGRPYHEVERQLLGFDHGELGALLIKEWNLSRELEDAVRWHHRFDDPEATNSRVAAMIALGEEVASCSGVTAEESLEESLDEDAAEPGPDPETVPDSPVCRYLGVTPGQFADLRAEAAKLQIDPHFFS